MNSALKIDLVSKEIVQIQMNGHLDVLLYFIKCDVAGRTLQKLGENAYLRMWTAVGSPATGIAIIDAYDDWNRLIDVPTTAKELGLRAVEDHLAFWHPKRTKIPTT